MTAIQGKRLPLRTVRGLLPAYGLQSPPDGTVNPIQE